MSGKWDHVEAITRRQETALGTTQDADKPLAPINQQIENIRNQQLDLIGRFKRNAIDRKAALESLRSMHDAQLEAAKHALRRAVDIEKERVDAVANRYIFQITEEYLRNLRDLGLQNYESRMETLLQLKCRDGEASGKSTSTGRSPKRPRRHHREHSEEAQRVF
jgi:prophage DNA circulation protein